MNENKTRCEACGEPTKYTYTAYLLDRSKREGLCKNCEIEIEKNDINNMTDDCFEKLCHAVNGGSPKNLAESMFRSIYRQHRHLQKEFFMALWRFFKLYGDQKENCYDARNEWAVRVAKRWEQATFD